MLIGLIMALAISVFVVSSVFTLLNFQEVSYMTGAVIGLNNIGSYSVFFMLFSFMIILFLIGLSLKKKDYLMYDENEFYRR